MHSIFSPDSKFSQIVGYACDLVVLNVIFLLTCLPIVTIGAASTALYTVCFQLGTEREGGLLRTYFRAFRSNFRQATVLWLILLVLIVAIVFDLLLVIQGESGLGSVSWIFLGVVILMALVSSYIFPLLSQFQNSIWHTLKNAMLLSLAYLPRSLLIAVLNLLPLALLLLDPYLFLQIGFAWLFFYFSGAAFINARLLRKVFAPYWSASSEEDD